MLRRVFKASLIKLISYQRRLEARIVGLGCSHAVELAVAMPLEDAGEVAGLSTRRDFENRNEELPTVLSDLRLRVGSN
jgi:hypothetical protein